MGVGRNPAPITLGARRNALRIQECRMARMKIYLVRHGIASETLSGSIRRDAERPLTDEGRAQTELVARGLKNIGVKPDCVLASPLVRARQTAEIIAEVFGIKDKLSVANELTPGISVEAIYKVINELRRVEEVFLVGHHPDVSQIAQALLWSGPDLDIPFEKAGVARIDVWDLPPTTPGTLKWMIPPSVSTRLAN
jgi:phosphohistidine phosphatase